MLNSKQIIKTRRKLLILRLSKLCEEQIFHLVQKTLITPQHQSRIINKLKKRPSILQVSLNKELRDKKSALQETEFLNSLTEEILVTTSLLLKKFIKHTILAKLTSLSKRASKMVRTYDNLIFSLELTLVQQASTT